MRLITLFSTCTCREENLKASTSHMCSPCMIYLLPYCRLFLTIEGGKDGRLELEGTEGGRKGCPPPPTKYLDIEHHSVCPLVGIGTPPTPPPLGSVPLPPRTKGWALGGQTRLRLRGWGSPNSEDWKKKLSRNTEGFEWKRKDRSEISPLWMPICHAVLSILV